MSEIFSMWIIFTSPESIEVTCVILYRMIDIHVDTLGGVPYFVKMSRQSLRYHMALMTRIRILVASGSAIHDDKQCTMTAETMRQSGAIDTAVGTIKLRVCIHGNSCPGLWQVDYYFISLDIKQTQILSMAFEPTRNILRSQTCQGK